MTIRDCLALWANWAFEGPDYRTWLIHSQIAQLVALSPFGWRAAVFFYLGKEIESVAYRLKDPGPIDWRFEDRIPDALFPVTVATLTGWLLSL